MRFLSIYKTIERNEPPTQEEMERMGALIHEGMQAGYLVGVDGCLPSFLGARVRQTNCDIVVTDGPFTETKEIIGGMAILSVNSKEEAIEVTKSFLAVAGDGECELRQLYDAPAA